MLREARAGLIVLVHNPIEFQRAYASILTTATVVFDRRGNYQDRGRLVPILRSRNAYILGMCGRVLQSSAPIRYAILDGMDVRDSRVHNYPPRWNAAPSQELLVIRRNHETGQVSLDPLRWGLIPAW